jgi:hypothetical protein
MFPADPILLARGKYATLSKERRRELRLAQDLAQNLMNQTSQIMRDLETEPPVTGEFIEIAGQCLAGLKESRERVVGLSTQMQELKPVAWK